MANKAYVFCAMAGVLFINGQKAHAEEPNEDVNYQTQSSQEKKPQHTQQTLADQLESAILLWNDAMIDADEAQIASCRKTVFSLLGDDIKGLEKQLKSLEKASVSFKRDKSSANPVDRSEEVRVREMLHEKTELLASIKNSNSFGTTYRLLGDYLYLLRQDEVPAMAQTADSCLYMDSLK